MIHWTIHRIQWIQWIRWIYVVDGKVQLLLAMRPLERTIVASKSLNHMTVNGASVDRLAITSSWAARKMNHSLMLWLMTGLAFPLA